MIKIDNNRTIIGNTRGKSRLWVGGGREESECRREEKNRRVRFYSKVCKFQIDACGAFSMITFLYSKVFYWDFPIILSLELSNVLRNK